MNSTGEQIEAGHPGPEWDQPGGYRYEAREAAPGVTNEHLFDRLVQIEAKIDALLEALAEDEDDRPTHDLNGSALPAPGGAGRSL